MSIALGLSALRAWPAAAVAMLLSAATPIDVESIAVADARLATIAYRLQTGNAALCRRLAPVPGVVLISVGQYPVRDRSTVTKALGLETSIGVEAVVPGSPAETAGLKRGDSLVAVGGVTVDQTLMPTASAAERDAALDLLARQPADRPVALVVQAQGHRRSLVVPPSPGCRVIVEVRFGTGLSARADDRRIQIGNAFLDRYDDASVAAVVAHELAHVVLDHYDRLRTARIGRGPLAAWGRDGRAIRRTEDAADALSVALLYNAGFDPAAAVALWRNHGRDFGAGLLHDPRHGRVDERMRLLEAEIVRIPMHAPRPYRPAALSSRDGGL